MYVTLFQERKYVHGQFEFWRRNEWQVFRKLTSDVCFVAFQNN